MLQKIKNKVIATQNYNHHKRSLFVENYNKIAQNYITTRTRFIRILSKGVIIYRSLKIIKVSEIRYFRRFPCEYLYLKFKLLLQSIQYLSSTIIIEALFECATLLVLVQEPPFYYWYLHNKSTQMLAITSPKAGK